MNDPYLDLVRLHWDTIYRSYSDFAEKKPVILLHLKEAKVYIEGKVKAIMVKSGTGLGSGAAPTKNQSPSIFIILTKFIILTII